MENEGTRFARIGQRRGRKGSDILHFRFSIMREVCKWQKLL